MCNNMRLSYFEARLSFSKARRNMRHQTSICDTGFEGPLR